MAIYMKTGMEEMPIHCFKCNKVDCVDFVDTYQNQRHRPKNCPLVSMPSREEALEMIMQLYYETLQSEFDRKATELLDKLYGNNN